MPEDTSTDYADIMLIVGTLKTQLMRTVDTEVAVYNLNTIIKEVDKIKEQLPVNQLLHLIDTFIKPINFFKNDNSSNPNNTINMVTLSFDRMAKSESVNIIVLLKILVTELLAKNEPVDTILPYLNKKTGNDETCATLVASNPEAISPFIDIVCQLDDKCQLEINMDISYQSDGKCNLEINKSNKEKLIALISEKTSKRKSILDTLLGNVDKYANTLFTLFKRDLLPEEIIDKAIKNEKFCRLVMNYCKTDAAYAHRVLLLLIKRLQSDILISNKAAAATTLQHITELFDAIKIQLSKAQILISFNRLTERIDDEKRSAIMRCLKFMEQKDAKVALNLFENMVNSLLDKQMPATGILTYFDKTTSISSTVGMVTAYNQTSEATIQYLQLLATLLNRDADTDKMLAHLNIKNVYGNTLATLLTTKNSAAIPAFIDLLCLLDDKKADKEKITALMTAKTVDYKSIFDTMIANPDKYADSLFELYKRNLLPIPTLEAAMEGEKFCHLVMEKERNDIAHAYRILMHMITILAGEVEKKNNSQAVFTKLLLINDYFSQIKDQLSAEQLQDIHGELTKPLNSNKVNILMFCSRGKETSIATFTLLEDLTTTMQRKMISADDIVFRLYMRDVYGNNLGTILTEQKNSEAATKYLKLLTTMLDHGANSNDMATHLEYINWISINTARNNPGSIPAFIDLILKLNEKKVSRERLLAIIDNPSMYPFDTAIIDVLNSQQIKYLDVLRKLINNDLLSYRHFTPCWEFKYAIFQDISTIANTSEKLQALKNAAGLGALGIEHPHYKLMSCTRSMFRKTDPERGFLKVIHDEIKQLEKKSYLKVEAPAVSAPVADTYRDPSWAQQLPDLKDITKFLTRNRQDLAAMIDVCMSGMTLRQHLYDQATIHPTILYKLLDRDLVPAEDYQELSAVAFNMLSWYLNAASAKQKDDFIKQMKTAATPLHRFMYSPEVIHILKAEEKSVDAELAKHTKTQALPPLAKSRDAFFAVTPHAPDEAVAPPTYDLIAAIEGLPPLPPYNLDLAPLVPAGEPAYGSENEDEEQSQGMVAVQARRQR